MSQIIATVLVLTYIQNNALFISRPEISVGEEAFLCPSYDDRKLHCSWAAEWERLLLKTVNGSNVYVKENITDFHYVKLRYMTGLGEEEHYIDSRWIRVKKRQTKESISEETYIITSLCITIVVLLLCIPVLYVIYKKIT